jgi:hypothetical protein
MRKITVFANLLMLVLILSSCTGGFENEYQFNYPFEEDQQGWLADFADLPADFDPEFYELDSGWTNLPSGIAGNAIYLTGNNHSDDLFMFIKTEVEGLKPDTTYKIIFSLDLANNTPEGMMGIGGSPGESVYVKAGAVNFEPDVIEDASGWLRMNFDKGNQARESDHMITLGTLANPNIDLDTFTGMEYSLMTLDNQSQIFTATTDDDGSIWVMIGIDSGFEGLTKVYFDKVLLSFESE